MESIWSPAVCCCGRCLADFRRVVVSLLIAGEKRSQCLRSTLKILINAIGAIALHLTRHRTSDHLVLFVKEEETRSREIF